MTKTSKAKKLKRDFFIINLMASKVTDGIVRLEMDVRLSDKEVERGFTCQRLIKLAHKTLQLQRPKKPTRCTCHGTYSCAYCVDRMKKKERRQRKGGKAMNLTPQQKSNIASIVSRAKEMIADYKRDAVKACDFERSMRLANSEAAIDAEMRSRGIIVNDGPRGFVLL